MRIVKAFALEDEMRRRLDEERRRRSSTSPTRWRASPTAPSPLMETLGGFAIALAIDLRRLPRDRDRRDARRVRLVPGRLPARLRAGQAAGAAQHRSQQRPGRRARAVRGHRQPAGRAERRRPAAAQAHDGAPGICRRALRLSRRRAGAARHELRRRARQGHRAGRCRPAAANRRCSTCILRFYDVDGGTHPDRRAGHRDGVAPLAARADRLCRAERSPVPRHDPREHRARQARRQRSRDRRRRQGRARARFHHRLSARATTRRSASTACSFPAASASASRSRAR